MKPRLVQSGDSCLSVLFEEIIDPVVNAHCVAIAASVEQWSRPGIRDVVPTYNGVTVHFDPLKIDREDLGAELTALAATETAGARAEVEPILIPVKYGEDSGPDLAAVAEFGRCAEREVIRLHGEKLYRVYMLGFLPGFAYMGSVDARIAMPRLDEPRMRVPAGAVGIAGLQTGIYPCDTPGGWRIIGRTLTKVFDPGREKPCLLKAGDYVKFVAV